MSTRWISDDRYPNYSTYSGQGTNFFFFYKTECLNKILIQYLWRKGKITETVTVTNIL